MSNPFKSPHVEDRQIFSALLARTHKAMVKILDERHDLPVDNSIPDQETQHRLANFSLSPSNSNPLSIFQTTIGVCCGLK